MADGDVAEFRFGDWLGASPIRCSMA